LVRAGNCNDQTHWRAAAAEIVSVYKQAQYYAIEGRSNEALDKLRTWLDYGMDIFTYIKQF